jgi:RHS repeat-associated protein
MRKYWGRGVTLLTVLVAACGGGDSPSEKVAHLEAALSTNPPIVIRQIYGHTPSSTIKCDFIELFNRSSTATSIAGWSLQYGKFRYQPSSGNGTGSLALPSVTLSPGQSLLVQEKCDSGATLPVTPDVVDPNPIDSLVPPPYNRLTGGGIVSFGLSSSVATSDFPSCSDSSNSSWVDLVGCMSPNRLTLNQLIRGEISGVVNVTGFEGCGPAIYESAFAACDQARLRKGNGAQDTNSNYDDFITQAPPEFRNSASLSSASSPVVIRQYFGHFASTSAPACDFVELFNRSALGVPLEGWYLSEKLTDFPNPAATTELPSIVLAPGQSLLVQEACDSGASLPIPPDVVDPTPFRNMVVPPPTLPPSGPAGGGSVWVGLNKKGGALADSVSCYTSSGRSPNPIWGESSHTGQLGDPSIVLPPPCLSTGTTSYQRKLNGNQDTNENTDDFAVAPLTFLNAGSYCNPATADPRVGVALDMSVPTSLADSVAPLYVGVGASQRGVAPGTIDQKRIAVVQGKVLAEDGSPLACVEVDVPGSPQYSKTRTWADGTFAIVVNGGGAVTVRARIAGYLESSRTATTKWLSSAAVNDIRLLKKVPSSQAQLVSASATTTTTALGQVETDTDGTRQAALLFPPGTVATVDGQNLNSYSVTVKEMTNRDHLGRDGMIAPLPPQTAFTYAIDLSVLGAEDRDVSFNKNIGIYVDNFLNIPKGKNVPVGRYDRNKQQWVAEPNGRVLQASVDASNNVLVDFDDDASADDPAILGITPDELAFLRTRVAAGKTKFWRVPVNHFSAYDFNWGIYLPPDATPPNPPPPVPPPPPCNGVGSIIECESRVLREEVPVAATPFKLVYSSGRQAGSARRIKIPLMRDRYSHSVTLHGIVLSIMVAGWSAGGAFAPQSDLAYVFDWDGRDVAGRRVVGAAPIDIEVRYLYDSGYSEVPNFAGVSLSQIGGNVARSELWLSSSRSSVIGDIDAHYPGLGGWTLNVHHSFDPRIGVLYLGNGEKRDAGSIIPEYNTVVGGGASTADGTPALQAQVPSSGQPGLAVGADGSIWFSTANNFVGKVDGNGVFTRIGGFSIARGMAFGSDGNLYVADGGAHQIKKIDIKSGALAVTAYVGTGTAGYLGDGGEPLLARLNNPTDVAFAPDGTLYVSDSDNGRVRRIRDNRISTFGSGTSSGLRALVVSADGRIVVSRQDGIYEIPSTGALRLLTPNLSSDAYGLAVAPDGLIYFADSGRLGGKSVVRRLETDGTTTVVAGTGASGYEGEHVVAAQTKVAQPMDVAFGPDGAFYVREEDRIRKVNVTSSLDVFQLNVPSSDGKQLFIFDSKGKHLSTVDAFTGATLYSFSYAPSGLLSKVTDVAGRDTLIQRTASGVASSIQAPDGQVTALSIDSEDNLTSVSYIDTSSYTFRYGPGSMLISMTDPLGAALGGKEYTFTYDHGLLATDKDPRAGVAAQRLDTLPPTLSNETVTITTAAGKIKTFSTNVMDGVQTRTITHRDGTVARESRRLDGARAFPSSNPTYSTELIRPDGTKIYSLTKPDPTYGAAAAFVSEQMTLLPSSLQRVEKTARARTTNSMGVIAAETISTVVNGDTAHPFTTSFDGNTKTFTTTSREGRVASTTFDSLGRPSVVQRAGIMSPLSFQYDAVTGHIASITRGYVGSPTARVRQFEYFSTLPKTGFLQSITETSGTSVAPFPIVTTFDRDGLGRPIATAVGGATTGLSWDANGNLSGVTPPGQMTHQLTSNEINLLSSYMPPAVSGIGAPSTNYSYDADRTLLTETRPGLSAGALYQWSLDTFGRHDTLSSPGFLLDYDYYPNSWMPPAVPVPPAPGEAPGGISSLRGPYGVNLAFAYDGQLPTKVSWSGDITGEVRWVYNSEFEVDSETVAGSVGGTGSVIRFGHDHDGLVTCASVSDCAIPGADALTIFYSTARLPESIKIGGVAESLTYNANGELATQVAKYGSVPLMSITYDDFSSTNIRPRDALGRVVRKSESFAGSTLSSTFDYSYDPAGRLVSVYRGSSLIEQFTYDLNGNRKSHVPGNSMQTDFVDAQDRWDQARVANYGNVFFGFSPNGEVKSRQVKTPSAGPATSYVYDVLGNLASVSVAGGNAVEYLVDGLNRRVGKRVNGTLMRRWLYRDALAPVVELDGAGSIIARFVYASRANVPDYVIRGTKTYRILSDQLGSPRMAVNIADINDAPYRADYSGFGVQTMVNGNSDWLPFGFGGGLYDADTGLVRFGARDYDPFTGRWMQKDPIRFGGQQTNLYAYVDSDPVNGRDPSGLVSWQCFSDCVGAQGTSSLAASALVPICGAAAPPVGLFYASLVASSCYFVCTDLESVPRSVSEPSSK